MVSAACALSETKTTPSAGFLARVVIRYAYVMRKPSTPAVPIMRQFTLKTLLTELLIRACRKMHGNLSLACRASKGALFGQLQRMPLCGCWCSSSSIAFESLLGMQPSDAGVDVGLLILVDPPRWDPFG
jgi:hypothetical protein